MTITISLQFPAGRFHGTPWDRAPNEGVAEWPPSPWRLLRALYAVWRWRVPEVPEALVHAVLAKIAEPPTYSLPATGRGHLRHYMPDISFRAGQSGGTDKVVDPFVSIAPTAPVMVRWSSTLDDDDHRCLAALCAAVTYLGRTESLCRATLLGPECQMPDRAWVVPGLTPGLDRAPTRLPVPQTPLDIEALTVTTASVRKQRHRLPDGARLVPYQVPAPGVPQRARRSRHGGGHTGADAALLVLDGPVRPAVYQSVVVADAMRSAVLKHTDSATLVGRKQQVRLDDDHRHAHWVPVDLDHDRLLDAVVVWAPGGLAADDVDALSKVDRLWGRELRQLRVSLQAVGSGSQYLSSGRMSQVWRSVTPFASARHRKAKALEHYLLESLQCELRYRDFPPATRIKVIRGDWGAFDRRRRNRGVEVSAWGVELTLATPVSGPLCLGTLSHFGLGRFVPS